MKLPNNHLLTLSILANSSRGLDVFSLFRRLNLSFSEFTKALKNLTEQEFVIESKEDFFQATLSGRQFWSKQLVQRKEKPWREVPERFLGTKLKADSFYIPSISKLDINTFKVKKNNIK
tara:strand:+ start:4676 stop:5032 length:357 start_codon:yes stop_codon:yes gene_type:complete